MSTFNLPNTALVLGLLASTLVMAGPAFAADLDVDPAYADVPAPIPQQVTFGSGWYVRGDLGGSYGFSGTASDPTLGSAPGLLLNKTKDIGYTGSLGAGYQINNYIRVDTGFDYHKPINSSRSGAGFRCPYLAYGTPIGGPFVKTSFKQEQCSSTLQAKIDSYDLMLNGYFDFGTFSGFTPYVGAGVGIGFGQYQTSANYFTRNGSAFDFTYTDAVTLRSINRNYDESTSGTYYNVAWALMAGVSYDIYSHTKIDISYRYLNLGRILGTNVSTQEARAGLRYMIDN